jgi:transcriptional regulator with XRE-family HTH domain
VSRTRLTAEQHQRGLALARELSQRREGLGKTQAEIAEAARVPLDTLRAIEHGRSANPGVFFIVDLARVLGVKVEELTR